MSGTLREGTSLLNPQILFEIPSDELSSVIQKVNYMYIEDFGRYYFVNNIVSVGYDLWSITAHVDVLKSYASQIKASNAIINRQESLFNIYLDDPEFKCQVNPHILQKEFPSGFDTGNIHFVLTVAGSNSSSSSTTTTGTV